MKNILAFLQKHLILTSFISWLILTTLSFAMFNMPFIWFSYAPLIFILHRLSLRELATYGFIFGFLFAFCTQFWLIAFHELSIIFVFPMFGMYFAFVLMMSRYCAEVFPRYKMLFFPLFFTAMEVLRSMGFLGFRWNLPADALWKQLVFLQSADIFGAVGVTLIILLVNAGIAEILTLCYDEKLSLQKAILKRYLPLYIITFIFFCNLAYGIAAYSRWADIVDNKVIHHQVALLQANRPGHQSWSHNEKELTEKYLNMAEKAAELKPDLILQTEIMISTYLWHNLNFYGVDSPKNQYLKQIVEQPKKLGIPMMLTHFDVDTEKDRTYNAATLVHYSNDTMMTNTYRKIHIVPFGEWVPGSKNWRWLDNLLGSLGAAWASPGEEVTIFETLDKIKFAMLICFEDLYAMLGRLFVDKGAQYFVNATNDGWAYRWKIGSEIPLWQHLANTTQTAISLRRSIARSVNTGMSAVVDPVGRMDIAPLKPYTEGIYVADVPVMPSGFQTVYNKKGFMIDYFVFFGAIAVILLSFIKDRDNKILKEIIL
ncbi:MAG: apolipoprotein N-acyltransferase [Brevinema sp.]